MATHSRILAWRIPWTEEPGGLQPVGSQRVRRDSTHTPAFSRGHCGVDNSLCLKRARESFCPRAFLTIGRREALIPLPYSLGGSQLPAPSSAHTLIP